LFTATAPTTIYTLSLHDALPIYFDNVTCPGCGTVIPIGETIHHQIADLTRQELANETLRAREALAAKEQELKQRELSLTKTVEEKVATVQADLSVAIAAKLRAELSTEIADLTRQADERSSQLARAQ